MEPPAAPGGSFVSGRLAVSAGRARSGAL